MDPEEISLLLARDRAAQERLYAACVDAVYSAILRIVQSPSAAADLTHDTFILAFERIDQYHNETPVINWIRRIGVTQALQYLRRRRVRHRVLDALSRKPSYSRPTPLEIIDVDTALGKLPDTLRVPLLLHSVEGYSHEEIAAQLQISAGASRARVHRARSELKTMLGGDHDA